MPSFGRQQFRSPCSWDPSAKPHDRSPQRRLPRPPRVSAPGSRNFTISGVTVDSVGAPLGNCRVILMRAGDDSVVARAVSDGSGSYSFALGDNAGSFYVLSFNAAGTLAGSTLPTLAAV